MFETLKAYHDFSEAQIKNPGFSSEGLAHYLTAHFLDKSESLKSIKYCTELFNRLDVEVAVSCIIHPAFRQAAEVLIDEHLYLPSRDVPIALDMALRFTRQAPQRTEALLSAYVEVAWARHPDANAPAHMGEFLLLASYNPAKPMPQYLERLRTGMALYFPMLSGNQLNRVFSTENKTNSTLIKRDYDALLASGGIEGIVRLYILSASIFPDKRVDLLGRILSLNLSKVKEKPTRSLVNALQRDELFSISPSIPIERQNHGLSRGVKKRLRLALCISGQMRGFERAFNSWQKALKLDELDVTIFVSTWRGIGGKGLTAEHMYRHYPQSLASLMAKRWLMLGEKRFRDFFPALCAVVEKRQVMQAERIKDFYQTEHVMVHDDDIFSEEVSSSERMHFKIEHAWNMAYASGESFDLYLRIRPDKYLESLGEGINWDQLYEQCTLGRIIYSDLATCFRLHHGNSIGDQMILANWDTARVIHRPFSLHYFALRNGGYLGQPPYFCGHATLGMLCYAAGIENRRFSGLLLSNETLLGTSAPTQDEIVAALISDRTPENEKDIDHFLTALWGTACN